MKKPPDGLFDWIILAWFSIIFFLTIAGAIVGVVALLRYAL